MKIDMTPSGVSLHFQKYKASSGEINGLQRHDERRPGGRHSNENIDPEKTKNNVLLVTDDRKLDQRVADRIETGRTVGRGKGLKGVRKDAVRMYEVTVQPSGKIWDRSEAEQVAVLKDAFEWLKDRVGAENVISAAIHVDESHPHLHMDFVPIEDGRLDAKHMVTPVKLKKLQDDFLKHLQETSPTLNFRRGDGATSGLTKEAFVALTEAKKQAEADADAREDALDAREDALDRREGEADRIKEAAQAAAERTKAEGEAYKADRVAEGDRALTDAKAEAATIATSSTGKTEAELDAQEAAQAVAKAADQADRQQWVKKYNTAAEKLKTAQATNRDRDATLTTREDAVKGREDAVTVREAKARKDAKEAAQKLAEAQQMQEDAATLLETAKKQAAELLKVAKEKADALQKRLMTSWQRVLDMVRAGELKPTPVEKVAEKYHPVTEETAPALSVDLDALVDDAEKAQGRGL